MILNKIPSLKVNYPTEINDNRNYRVDFSKIEKNIKPNINKNVQDGIEELVYCFQNGILTKYDYESNNLDHLKKIL